MANSAGSRKRARQALKRNKHNSPIRAKVRTFVKKVAYAIAAGDKKEAVIGFTAMQKNVDQAVSKGLIHKTKPLEKNLVLALKLNPYKYPLHTLARLLQG